MSEAENPGRVLVDTRLDVERFDPVQVIERVGGGRNPAERLRESSQEMINLVMEFIDQVASNPQNSSQLEVYSSNSLPHEVQKRCEIICKLQAASSPEFIQRISHTLTELIEPEERKSQATPHSAEISNEPPSFNDAFPLDQWKALPGGLMVRLLRHVAHCDWLAMRQVCRGWNRLVSCSETFLNHTLLNLSSSYVDQMSRCRGTKVKWRGVRCDLLPYPEAYNVLSYQEKFIVSKIAHGPRWFLPSYLKLIILHDLQIQKDVLIKWLLSCPRLTHLRFEGCSVKRGRPLNWASEIIDQITRRLSSLVLTAMDAEVIEQLLSLFSLSANQLNELQVEQVGVSDADTVQNSRSLSVRRKRVEEQLFRLLGECLEGNVGMRIVRLRLEQPLTPDLLPQFITQLPSWLKDLEELDLQLFSNSSPEEYLSPQQIPLTTQQTYRFIMEMMEGSPNMTKVHASFIQPDFFKPNCEETKVWQTNCQCLKDLGLQFNKDFFSNAPQEIHERSQLRKMFCLERLRSFGGFLPAPDLRAFRDCFPWLKVLQVEGASEGVVTNELIGGIVTHYPKLSELSLAGADHVTDHAFTANSPSQNSFRSMSCLKVFRLRGNFMLTDVALMMMSVASLQVLQLVGSQLKVSLKVSGCGLTWLSEKSVGLTCVTLQLSSDTATLADAEQFIRSLPQAKPGGIQISI